MRPNIIIVSNGCLGDIDFFRKAAAQKDRRLLIACDGGSRYIAAAGLRPDVLVGDMDSIGQAELARWESAGVKIIKYTPDKDFTDTALALEYALDLQPRSIDIWAALGARIDHTLANIHLLINGKEKGVPVRLIDDCGEMFIAAGKTDFYDAVGCLVSLVAVSPVVEGISLTGFQYPLELGALRQAESRGISNVVTAPAATIHIQSGNLLVIRYWRQDVFPEAG